MKCGKMGAEIHPALFLVMHLKPVFEIDGASSAHLDRFRELIESFNQNIQLTIARSFKTSHGLPMNYILPVQPKKELFRY